MSDRSSDGFTLDELREEYDWMSDFMGRMAERIRGNTDVRSLAAYVAKLESENAKLRELVLCLLTCASDVGDACDKCPVNGGAGIWEFEDFCDSLLDRVHELRVEVNG